MNHKFRGTPTLSAEDAAVKLAELVEHHVYTDDLHYWAWPQMFGSTAGPFGGVGGCACTTFTMEAWVYHHRCAVIFCDGRVLEVTDKFPIPQVEAWRRPPKAKAK